MSNLTGLPQELLLYIVASGLDVLSALALASSSKDLSLLRTLRSFWLLLASSSEIVHPLPLPTFSKLDEIPLHELIDICKHHNRLHRNLSRLPNPILKNHREIMLQTDEAGFVHHFAFIPGGRYALIWFRSGFFSCWDLSSKNSSLDTTEGRIVSSYRIDGRPVSWNWEQDQQGPKVIVAMTSRSRGICLLTCIELNWLEEGVSSQKLCELKLPALCERVYVHHGTAWASGLQLNPFIIVDPYSSRSICIDSGIREGDHGQYDAFPNSSGGLVLYCEDGNSALAEVYLDYRISILKKATRASGTEMVVLQRGADFVQHYEFDDGYSLKDHRDWFVTHPWNTPNYGRDSGVSIMSTSRGTGVRPGAGNLERLLADMNDQPSFRSISHHWFRPPSTPELYASQGTSIQLRRWIHHFPELIEGGIGQQEIICPGSHGTHLMWIWENTLISSTESGAMVTTLERRLHFATLLESNHPGRVGCPPELVIRDLLIDPRDIELQDVITTDIEDTHGIIGMVMSPRATGETILHLLYY